MERTVSFHVDLKTFRETAGLALVAPRYIHDAASVLFAHVIQIPAYIMILRFSVRVAKLRNFPREKETRREVIIKINDRTINKSVIGIRLFKNITYN